MKIERISGSIGLSFRQFIFTICQAEGYQNILKLRYIPRTFNTQKAFFLKKKRGLGLVSLPYFLHNF